MVDETIETEEVYSDNSNTGDNLPALNNQQSVSEYKREEAALLTVHDLESQGVPDLYDETKYERLPLDLASDYWFPKADGESKRLLFDRYAISSVPDKFGPNKNVEGATVDLETAFFYEMKKGGEEVSTIRQASKSLLLTMKQLSVKHGTLLEIVFKGLVKFPNGNTGQTWGVFPIKALPPKT